MREIKFRVWGVDVNGDGEPRMHFTGDIRDTDQSRRTFSMLEDEDILELNPWMQYTGLKDKNGTGVEVYESDLVQRRDGKRGEVIWHQDSCGFGIAFGDDEPLGSLSSWFEVVGNKYENPELLEAKS